MLLRIHRTVTRVAVLLAGLGLLLALVGTSTPSSATPAATDSDVALAGVTSPSVPLRLVTGDMLRISEGPDGQPGVVFAGEEAGSQDAQSYLRYVDSAGDLHVVPEVALPYLGDRLDAELFAASALIRARVGTSPTDGVPVVVAYTDGPVAVPGLTVTETLPDLGQAVGVIDADGAARFGAALAALDGAAFFAGVDRLWLDDGSAPSADAPTTGQQSAVTIEVIPPDDGPDLAGWVAVLGLDSGTFEVYDVEPGAMTLELELADGRYSASFYGVRQPTGTEIRIYTVTAPQVEVTGPMEVELDVRTTIEATYEVDADPAEVSLDVTTVRFGDVGSSAVGWSALFFDNMRAFLAPTDPVSSGTFDQVVAWAGPDAERYYTLPVVMSGFIPDSLHFVLGPEDLAEITSHYARDVDGEYYIGRFAYTVAGGGSAITPNPAPGTRTDVVTVDGVTTSSLVALDPGVWITFDRPAIAPVGGTSIDEDWITRPIRPGVPDGLKNGPPSRSGDELAMTVLTFADPDWAFGWADPGIDQPTIDTVSWELHADGELVQSGKELFGEPFAVDPEATSYELSLDLVRDADWWLTSTETSTTWTFDSARSEEQVLLDFLQVDYDVELDPYNSTDAPLLIGFRPYNLATPDDQTVGEFTAEWSVDDGETWDDVNELLESDGWWTGGIGGFVCEGECTLPISLRVTATDDSGATIEQTIMRAFMATFVENSATPTETPTTTEPTSEPPTTGEPTSTSTSTTTLPGTGGGSAAAFARLGGLAVLAGVVALIVARRRLAA